MGFFEQFPYPNFQQLNIDWVLTIVKQCEDTINHLNRRIEYVVRPMINEQQSYTQTYYNMLKNDLLQISAGMDSKNNALERTVGKQLYDNHNKMSELNRHVITMLDASEAKNQLVVTQYKQEVERLLTYYESHFHNLYHRLETNVQQMINDAENGMNAQLEAQNEKIKLLELEVKQTIDQQNLILQNAIAQLNQQFADLDTSLQEQMSDNLDTMRDMTNALQSELERITKQNTEYYNNVTNLILDMENILNLRIDSKADLIYVNSEVARLEHMIQSIQIDMTIVLNPVTQTYTTVQQAIDDIYYNVKPWALTCEEYDNIGIRAEEFDDITANGMTAYNFDNLSRWYLLYRNDMIQECKTYTDTKVSALSEEMHSITDSIIKTAQERWEYITKCCKDVNKMLQSLLFMSSPFDGIRRPIKDVLLQMFSYLYQDSLTADEYDAKQLTADTFDSVGITAYQYDWEGKTILGGI